MSAWLKAALIGAGILILLALIGLVPVLACITWLAALLAYLGIGVLAAHWMPAGLRTAGSAAGQGALAGAVAAAIAGVVNTVIVAVRMAIAPTTEVLSQLPPESLRQLEEVGLDPSIFIGPGAGIVYGSICCLTTVVIAAILAALAAAIYVAARPERPPTALP